MVKKGYFYGGSVKFVCDKNYTLVGTDVIYCQANRSWSSSVPRCLGTPYRTANNNDLCINTLVIGLDKFVFTPAICKLILSVKMFFIDYTHVQISIS